MKTLRNFLGKKSVKFGVGLAALALVAVAAGAPLHSAYAACPAVPADCTLSDVATNGIGTITDTITSYLVVAIPLVLAFAVGVMVTFAVIKLGFRWGRKFIH